MHAQRVIATGEDVHVHADASTAHCTRIDVPKKAPKRLAAAPTWAQPEPAAVVGDSLLCLRAAETGGYEAAFSSTRAQPLVVAWTPAAADLHPHQIPLPAPKRAPDDEDAGALAASFAAGFLHPDANEAMATVMAHDLLHPRSLGV